MSRPRSPEYVKRDLLFVHACELCARAGRCSFKTSQEGPEEVCRQLIVFGTERCEVCIRRNTNGGCHFVCVFFRKRADVVALSSEMA